MKTLTIGSMGSQVMTLQSGLNLLPSQFAQLALDGIFGQKTFGRVKEFQRLVKILVDGIVGPQTWAVIQQLLGPLERIIEVHRLRNAVISVARKEAKGPGMAVHAKKPGAFDAKRGKHFRAGHSRLLEYFRKAAPSPAKPGTTSFSEDHITYLITPNQLLPCPHWCGIFALWAHKVANVQVGTWSPRGISTVRGFHPTANPTRGDIAYVHKPFQHHAIIERVYLQHGQTVIDTINGNSSPDSCIKIKKQEPKTGFNAFYSAF